MRPVSVTARVGSPREHVFPLIADLAVRPAFTDHFISELRLQRIDSSGVGASARGCLKAPGGDIWMESVISEAEFPHRVVERGRGGRLDRIPIDTAWDLAPGPGESTEVTVTFSIQPRAIVDRLRFALSRTTWYRRQFKRALGRLREIAETGAEPERISIGGQSRVRL